MFIKFYVPLAIKVDQMIKKVLFFFFFNFLKLANFSGYIIFDIYIYI
jgi:hypothetical protein